MFGLKDKIREQIGAYAERKTNKAVNVASISRSISERSGVGPLAALEKNKFSTDDLRYPTDLGSNNFERLHYVTFYINVQEKSKYNVSERTNFSGQANANRFADTAAGRGQISGSNQALGAVGRAVGTLGFAAGGGALVGRIGGAIGGITGAVVGGAVGGAFGTAIGSSIVNNIDLSRKTKRIKSTITLYMPDTINQQIVHEFGEISMTEALGMVGLIGQGATAVGSSVEEAIKKGDLGEVFKGAGAGPTAEVGGALAEGSGLFGAGMKDAILFSAGLAVNPQVEILYQKTAHREFLFDFKMVPRNKAEADAIRKIIKQFKFHSAPELLSGAAGRYFVPPADFDIKFFFNGKQNENIHKISSCALVGMDVNYASAGQWTTFDDGMPVEVSMQLRFKELELIHKARIEEGY